MIRVCRYIILNITKAQRNLPLTFVFVGTILILHDQWDRNEWKGRIMHLFNEEELHTYLPHFHPSTETEVTLEGLEAIHLSFPFQF